VTYALTQCAIATTLTAGRARLLAFTVYGKYYTTSGLLPWNMEEQTSETSEAICPAIQRHIPEESNPQYRLQLLSHALKNLLKQQTADRAESATAIKSAADQVFKDLTWRIHGSKLQVTSNRTERVACGTHRTVNFRCVTMKTVN
jgi:ElaB/YqjD/DUF883 family membrane-anchored ribosome-binding protein